VENDLSKEFETVEYDRQILKSSLADNLKQVNELMKLFV
jgi:hypothetical protein